MKKFLSLVLALTMALSLVTVSAGATSFEDDGDITYQEAVTVIAGLGIVEGYDDGSFNPTGGLTRGAAAKIICNLILGPTTADALNATSAPFSDVPTTNEFAGYIAYCSQQGIISGYADGTFRPSASLTGYAFMKMLLGALGYNSTYEGYTGSNWSIQVAKQAIGIGLDDGNDDFNGTDNVTREEACLYAFNTLQATLVEYSSSNTIIVGDVEVTTASDRSEVENNDSDETIEDDGLMQFAEEYFEDLVAEDDTDGFGRPATTWEYDGDELGTYANDADETLVVSDSDNLEAWMTDGSNLNYSDRDILNDATVYYNGTDVGDYVDLTDSVIMGKGDILEAYENDDGDVETIVIRSYTYAKIDDVVTDLSSTHENRGASVSLDLVKIDDSSIGTYYDDYNDDDKILKGYNSDYTEGTVIAVALSEDDAVLDSYVMESITGTPTAARAVTLYNQDSNVDEEDWVNDLGNAMVSAGTITLDGTRYTYAGSLTGLGASENVSFDDEYTIYLTAEGYVLAVDGDATAALDDVYYVAGVYGERSAGRTTHYIETVSVTDGTYAVLELSSTGWNQFDAISTDTDDDDSDYDNTVNGLYVLDEDDGEYELDSNYTSRLEDGDDIGSYYAAVSTATGEHMSGLSQDVSSDSSAIRLSNSSETRLYLADDTFFVGIEGDTAAGDTLDITTATGVMTVDYKTSEWLSVYAIYDSDLDAVYVVYTASALSGSVSLSDVVYLTDDASTSNSDGYVVDLFLLDSMELSEDVTIDSDEDQGFFTYSVDSDGIYDLTTPPDSYNLAEQNLTNGEVDDEDGFATGVTFTEVRSNRATGSTDEDGDLDQSGEVDFVAVSFANASVIDTRGSSAKNNSLYSSDIESVSALSTAISRGWVEADVFVEDGEIVFVAVTDTERETSSSSAETPSNVTISANVGSYVNYNDSVTLTANATVSDGGTLTYQWYKDGDAISGATGSTYTFNATESAAYTYRVTNTNETTGRTSSVTSAAFNLTVGSAPMTVNITCILLDNASTIYTTTQSITANTEIQPIDLSGLGYTTTNSAQSVTYVAGGEINVTFTYTVST